MAQRNAERLVMRAIVDAGWRYRQAKTGIVVYPPDGERPVSVHLNHTVKGYSLTGQLQQLRRRGLAV